MNKDTNIIIRTDSDIKKEFLEIVYKNGHTASNVLNAFIVDIVEKNRIPNNILTKLKPVKRKEIVSIPYIKKCLREILEKSKKYEDISKAYLFGSYARGEETSLSDVDIRLEVNDNFTLFDLTEIAYNLEEKLNKKVDIITSGNLDELLYEEIKKEEICIYSK
jgi:predicted nucleotidyltransferase